MREQAWVRTSSVSFSQRAGNPSSEEGTVKSAILLSKKSNEVELYSDGLRAGEQWAQNDADYEQLLRVFDLTQFDQDDFDGALRALCIAANPDYAGSPKIIEDLFGHERDVSDAEAAGFISGAREYFKDLI